MFVANSEINPELENSGGNVESSNLEASVSEKAASLRSNTVLVTNNFIRALALLLEKEEVMYLLLLLHIY